MNLQIVCHLGEHDLTQNYTKITGIWLLIRASRVLLCINANKMAQTALQNIATSIVNAPYASTGLGSSGTRVPYIYYSTPEINLLNMKQWLFKGL